MRNQTNFSHHYNALDLFPTQVAAAIKGARRVAEKSQYGASKIASLIYNSFGQCALEAVNTTPQGIAHQQNDFVNGNRNFLAQHAEEALLQLYAQKTPMPNPIFADSSATCTPDEDNLLVCTHPICAPCARQIICANAIGLVKISSILVDNRHIGLTHDAETEMFLCRDPTQYERFLLKWSDTSYFAGDLLNRANIPVYVAELMDGKSKRLTIARWHGMPEEHYEYIRKAKWSQRAEQVKNSDAEKRSLDGYRFVPVCM